MERLGWRQNSGWTLHLWKVVVQQPGICSQAAQHNTTNSQSQQSYKYKLYFTTYHKYLNIKLKSYYFQHDLPLTTFTSYLSRHLNLAVKSFDMTGFMSGLRSAWDERERSVNTDWTEDWGLLIMGTATPSQSCEKAGPGSLEVVVTQWEGISGTYYRQSPITSKIGSQQVSAGCDEPERSEKASHLCPRTCNLPRCRRGDVVMLWSSPVYLFCMETCWGVSLQFEEVSELSVYVSLSW